MHLKQHMLRIENMKTLQALDAAKIDHKVIALFMSSEGVLLDAKDIGILLNSFDVLGFKKIPSKKTQALIQAKQLGQADEALPCPI
jgi:hypothetical protein